MRVEVAICTWNRASLLNQTLEKMRHLNVPAGVEWEILVVNNNCTDATDKVLRQHDEFLPIRRLFESRPGLSHARNCAAAVAHGDLLLWTDDDVLVDPHWLEHYVEAAQRDPAASFFGGPIEPWFEMPPPNWVTPMLSVPGISGAFALRDIEDCAVLLDERNLQDLPFGANFAVRTELQKKYHYDPRLGRTKKGTLSGEETSLLTRMVDDGHSGRWVPDARVRHFIPKERLSYAFLRKFFFGLGRTNIRINDQATSGDRLWLLKQICYAELMYGFHRMMCNYQKCAQHLIHGCQLWGELVERSSQKRNVA